jgi:hypothetical protein
MYSGLNIPIPIISQKCIDNFWKRVDIKDDVTACWEWKGVISKYGKVWLNVDDGRKRFAAHRISYYLTNKVDPKQLMVCHKCDNMKCCNPNHLFIGTGQDNVLDMIKKGRDCKGIYLNAFQKNSPELIPRGESNGLSKLTNGQVLGIRKDYNNGKISQLKLGNKYGVSRGAVYAIIHRITWNHI